MASLERFDSYCGIGDDDDRRGLDAFELAELAALDAEGDSAGIVLDLDADDIAFLRAVDE